MIGLLQRVTEASVTVEQNIVGAIETGMLVLIGIEKNDNEQQAEQLLHKLLRYRVFPDAQGKMNLSVQDINGGLLLVPQFTLVADTRKGLRPSFSSAATPDHSRRIYDYLLQHAKRTHRLVESGQFGADMKVNLCNDGPVTFYLRADPEDHKR